MKSEAQEIDALLLAAIERGDIPYVLGGVTDRRGRTHLFCHGQDSATGRAIVPDTLFWIASMTKALTSVAALQLVEQGKLSLDGPIGAVLPVLQERLILEGFDDAGRPMLRPARAPLTLAHLLSHSSGFAEDVWSAKILRYLEVTGVPSTRTGKLTAIDLPLLFEPGTAWHYGISHDWVGRAIEAASGQRLEQYFSDNLFRPLGMSDTTYAPDDDQKRRMVSVHHRGPDGALHPKERTPPPEREFPSGGGTMFSTGPDYLAFIAMLLNGGQHRSSRLLQERTLEMMTENRTGDAHVSWVDPALPELSNRAEFLPGSAKCWGLGAMVNLEDLPTGRHAGSLAWAGLGNTYFWADPVGGIGGVLMTQILPFADKRVMQLFDDFEAACYRRFA